MRNALLALLLFCGALPALSQTAPPEEKKGFQRDKLFVGGNFGLTFGDYTLINISPQLGYRFTEHVAAGMGINAQYISVKQYYNGQTYSKTSQGVTGLNIFGRVYPIDQLMIQVQPEANYVFGKIKYYNSAPGTTKLDALIVPSLLVGGGAVFPSGRGSFIASVFYDILQDRNSPYGARPIYNLGYNISLH